MGRLEFTSEEDPLVGAINSDPGMPGISDLSSIKSSSSPSPFLHLILLVATS